MYTKANKMLLEIFKNQDFFDSKRNLIINRGLNTGWIMSHTGWIMSHKLSKSPAEHLPNF